MTTKTTFKLFFSGIALWTRTHSCNEFDNMIRDEEKKKEMKQDEYALLFFMFFESRRIYITKMKLQENVHKNRNESRRLSDPLYFRVREVILSKKIKKYQGMSEVPEKKKNMK